MRHPDGDGPDHRIARLAGGQSNVVQRHQLVALGLSTDQIDSRLYRGILHPKYPGVYAYGTPTLETRGELAAALLYAGPRSWLSGATAAALRRLGRLDLDRIHVTVESGTGRRRSGLILHRTAVAPHPEEIDRWRGLRLSAVPRVLVELAKTYSQRQLEDVITLAVRAKQFDLPAIERMLARHPHAPGLAKLKRALRHYRDYASSKSRFERAFDHWLAKHPEIPAPLKNVYIDGWEVDRYWAQYNLVVELDGDRWHSAIPDVTKDNEKDSYLQTKGIRVVRIDEQRWETGKLGILATLHALMGITPR